MECLRLSDADGRQRCVLSLWGKLIADDLAGSTVENGMRTHFQSAVPVLRRVPRSEGDETVPQALPDPAVARALRRCHAHHAGRSRHQALALYVGR